VKVLHVIPSLALAHGGPSRAVRMMERALREQGIEVEVAACDDDGRGGRTGLGDGSLRREADGDHRYFAMTCHPYKVSLPFARWMARHAPDFDLIHVHALFSFLPVVAARAARHAGVPYVVRPLGTLAAYGLGARRPALKRLSLRWIEGPLLRDAAAVHFTSDMERVEAETLGVPMRSAVLPLAVDAAEPATREVLELRLPDLAGRPYWLFLSRLDPKKNVEGLLHAIARVGEGMDQACWLIAGSGEADYVASLQALSAELGVAPRVVWAGQLEGEAKMAALANARGFVLPSHSENFGIAAAEALAAGLPCVLGRGVAITADLERDGAALAVDTDAPSIAAAMQRVWADADLARSLGRQARDYSARHFSPHAMGRGLAELYGRLLSGQNAAVYKGAGNAC
jgi:glycosyltransferase involved in cell wall biosynthesis